MANVYGAQGVSPTLRGQATNVFELQAGEVALVPSGTWKLGLGRYLKVQEYDPISTIWRDIGDDGAGDVYLQSDGANHRVANQTGCAVGAFVTVAGSGYTSAPTVVASAGASVWIAIVGGAVNTSVTIGNGGANYVYPPQVIFSAPPSPGVQATGYASLTSGAVSSITVTDQGAGYTSPPTIGFLPDARDSTGAGAVASCALTGSGTVTAVLCTDHGNTQTSVPTLTFSGGGGTLAAATVLMNWCIIAVTVGVAGAGYTQQTGFVELRGFGDISTATHTYTNPQVELGLVRYRPSKIFLPTGTSGIIATTTSGFQYVDGGCYAKTPGGYALLGNGLITTAASISFTMGGNNDSFRMLAV